MNTQGQLIIKTKYDEAFPFSNNLARVQKNGRYGFIKPNGTELVPLVYDSISDYINGQAFLKGTMFYFDTLGVKNRVTPVCVGGPMNDNEYGTYTEGKLVGLLRKYTGDTLIEAKYLDVLFFDYMEIFAVKNHSGKYGIVSEKDSIIQPFVYDTVIVRNRWADHWLKTKVENKSGAIIPNGEVVAKSRYVSITKSQYCFLVKLKNAKSGFVYRQKEYWKH